MQINTVKIKNFKPFMLSGIKSIDMTAGSPIQIFIGDNGSGKSSLLNELTPYAAIKPTYNKNGLKRIEILHEGNEFILTSDFSNSGGAHSFVLNGTELNISGTSGIQNELAAHHLGYTDTVHAITHLEYKMCSMGKTERKNLLLTINPIDLSIVLTKHKLICSKIKEYKNNLNMLYKKKQEIESQLITESIREHIEKRHVELGKALTETTSELYHLKQLRTEITRELQDYIQISEYELDEYFRNIRTTITKINPVLTRFQNIDRTKPDSELLTESQFKEQLFQIAKARYTELETRLNTVLQDIALYQKHTEEFGAGISIQDLEEELSILGKKTYTIDYSNPMIPEDSYNNHCELFQTLTTLVSRYIEGNYKWNVRYGIRTKIANKYTSLYYKHIEKLQKISTLKSKISECEEYLKKVELYAPCDQIRLGCEYFTRFNEKTLSTREVLSTCKKELEYVETQNRRHEKALQNLEALKLGYEDAEELFTGIVTTLQISVLQLTPEEIALSLKQNPSSLLHRFKTIIEDAPKWYEKIADERRHFELSEKMKSMIEAKLPSIDFMKELMTTRKEEEIQLNTEISKVLKDQDLSQKEALLLKEFLDIKNTITQIQTELTEKTKLRILKANLAFCDIAIKESDAAILSYNEDLRELDATIKNQTGLLARLEDTVKTIEELETKKKNLEIVEWGISPYTGFPHQHMVDYTNILIHNANYVLSQVWSYPLKIVPIASEDPLDGTFEAEVEDVRISDISKLSKGQQAMVNLAWMFAFIVSKKLTNYPVFLDECDDGLDPIHKQRLLEWLKSIVDQGFVSQMWMVHHEAVLYEGFANSEVLCLMDGNIIRPEKMNEHVTFE